MCVCVCVCVHVCVPPCGVLQPIHKILLTPPHVIKNTSCVPLLLILVNTASHKLKHIIAQYGSGAAAPTGVPAA